MVFFFKQILMQKRENKIQNFKAAFRLMHPVKITFIAAKISSNDKFHRTTLTMRVTKSFNETIKCIFVTKDLQHN